MASGKDIYEAKIYAANIFAAGVWRGVGAAALPSPDVASLQWTATGKTHFRLDGDKTHFEITGKPHYQVDQ